MKIWHGLAGFVALQLGGCPFLFDTNICGDGDVDAFEECDDGNASNDDACLNTCIATFCGDGFLQPSFGEQCDDGNFVNGDGCDAACFDEGGNNCGDGIVDAAEGEECDDGNNTNFDGCATNCTVEQAGNILFEYVILAFDSNFGQLVAASTCNDPSLQTPIAEIRLLVGDDINLNSTLDDNEIAQDAFSICDQNDLDGDGTIEAGEFGFYGQGFFAGSFELFAIEYLDDAGNTIPWQTFNENQNFTRFSFSGGITIPANNDFIIVFQGDGSQVGDELQSFFGF
jgi:cysteine-rich repeat protein